MNERRLSGRVSCGKKVPDTDTGKTDDDSAAGASSTTFFIFHYSMTKTLHMSQALRSALGLLLLSGVSFILPTVKAYPMIMEISEGSERVRSDADSRCDPTAKGSFF